MPNNHVKSVSEITNIIKNLLESQIGLISVEGEISNFRPHYSGHRYFTLKDNNAQISCTMWKTRPVNFEMYDGLRVIVTGSITVYPPRGNYNMDIIFMIHSGVGNLYKEFEILKQKLSDLGYFETSRKKTIPEMPLNIGVSTSPTGAAVQDITSTIKRRFSFANIYFRPTIVQGDSAPDDIANAIEELNNTPSDVIIIGRGGGSIEDLWAYNTERVAHAIFNSNIPIISAVGHETDFTIADFVADLRAATPTAAAELVTPKTSIDLQEFFFSYQKILNEEIEKTIQAYYDKLNFYDFEATYSSFMNRIAYNYQWLDSKVELLNNEIKYSVNNFKNQFEILKNQCHILSPTFPLERGYALLQHNDNIIKNDTSLSNFEQFEIMRLKEKVIAKFDKLVEKN